MILDTVNIFVIYNYTQHNSRVLGKIRTCLECYVSLYLHYIQLIWLESIILLCHINLIFPLCLSGCKVSVDWDKLFWYFFLLWSFSQIIFKKPQQPPPINKQTNPTETTENFLIKIHGRKNFWNLCSNFLKILHA